MEHVRGGSGPDASERALLREVLDTVRADDMLREVSR